MKKLLIILLVFIVCGCNANSTMQQTLQEDLEVTTSKNEESTQIESDFNITKENWITEKGYFDVLNERSYINYQLPNFYIIHEYNFIENRIRFNNSSSSYIIELDPHKQDIRYTLTKPIYYLKNDLYKKAQLSCEIILDGTDYQPIDCIIEASDKQIFPVRFLLDNKQLVDNEENSSTYGKEMKFTPFLKISVINTIIDFWNTSTQQDSVLRDIKYHLLEIENGKDPNEIESPLSNYDLSYIALNKIRTLEKFNGIYSISSFFYYNYENVNILSTNDKLMKTLFTLLKIEQPFDSINDIDKEKFAMTIAVFANSEGYNCMGNNCTYKGELSDIYLGFKEGYRGVIPRIVFNQIAYSLTDQEETFPIKENQIEKNVIGFSKELDCFIVNYPEGDGDFTLAAGGITILDQKQEGDILTVELIKYSSFDYNNRNCPIKNYPTNPKIDNEEQLHEFVQNNLNSFPHWIVTLKDNDQDFYQVLSMKIK